MTVMCRDTALIQILKDQGSYNAVSVVPSERIIPLMGQISLLSTAAGAIYFRKSGTLLLVEKQLQAFLNVVYISFTVRSHSADSWVPRTLFYLIV